MSILLNAGQSGRLAGGEYFKQCMDAYCVWEIDISVLKQLIYYIELKSSSRIVYPLNLRTF